MPAILFEKYGAICREDAAVLEASLAALLPRGHVRVLEIGSFEGATGRGMKTFLERHGAKIDYWCIDPGILGDFKSAQVPFQGTHEITGKSEDCFHLVPDEFHLVFVDGNHSRNSVILDVFNYSTKVVPGGFMLFHDTSPTAQGKDYQYSGPNIPEFHIAVLEAFRLIGWPWQPWSLFMENTPVDDERYGMQSYRRAAA